MIFNFLNLKTSKKLLLHTTLQNISRFLGFNPNFLKFQNTTQKRIEKSKKTKKILLTHTIYFSLSPTCFIKILTVKVIKFFFKNSFKWPVQLIRKAKEILVFTIVLTMSTQNRNHIIGLLPSKYLSTIYDMKLKTICNKQKTKRKKVSNIINTKEKILFFNATKESVKSLEF